MTSKFLDIFGRAVSHFLLAAVVSLLLLAPDIMVQQFIMKTPFLFSTTYFAIFTLFGATLLLVKSNKVILVVLIPLMVLQITQIMNLEYFRDFLSPLVIGLLWIEFSDILEVSITESGKLFYGPIAIILSFSLIYLICVKSRLWRLTISYAPLLVILVLGFVPIRILAMDNPIQFFPAAARPSLVNTLNAYALYATVLLPREVQKAEVGTDYRPYHANRLRASTAGTIVVVMGESVSSQRMGLFGHVRQTTPRLSKRAQAGSLIAMPALSAGVSTRASLPLFFNILREPLNREAIATQETNLFRLAQSAGFRTSYISAQKSNLLAGIRTNYIDHLVTKDFYEDLFLEKLDDAIFDFLDDLDLTRPNFVVLHQRALHGTTQMSYENHPEFQVYDDRSENYEEQRKNAYDNGILYYDWFIDKVIDYFENRATEPLYVFVTSDHSQEMGEEGRYGHGNLALNSARIPFLLFTKNPDPRFIEAIKSLRNPTHYEVGLSIANLLGFEIVNPNEEAGVYYINGPRSFGKAGVLEIEKSGAAPPRVTRLIL